MDVTPSSSTQCGYKVENACGIVDVTPSSLIKSWGTSSIGEI